MVRKSLNGKRRSTLPLVLATAFSLVATGSLSLAQEALAGGGGGRSGITEECNETVCHVKMKGSTFVPDTLKIRPGATVVWTNLDKMPHTVTSDLPKDGQESVFDSDLSSPIAQGGNWENNFGTAGTFPYFCGIHPNMTGQVIVAGEPVGEKARLNFMLLMAVGVFGVFGAVAAIRYKRK
jgi:plastocyanin